jgi:hypothetical protein
VPFQTRINDDLPVAVEGAFSTSNPYESVFAGDNKFTAGAAGPFVGRFGWALNSTGVVTAAQPGGANTIGFVGLESNVPLITGFIADSGLQMAQGQEVTLYRRGDFYARFAVAPVIDQKVFADVLTGACRGGAAGAVIAGFTETRWSIDETGLAGELVSISVRS